MRALLFSLLVITGCLTHQTLAQSSSQATFPGADIYGKLPAKSLLAISPSGRYMAYRDKAAKHDLVVVVDTTSGEIVAGGNAEEVNPTDLYFVSDEKLVLVTVNNTRLFGYRGRHDISTAFVMDVKTNKVHQLLIAGYGIYGGQGGLGRILGISKDKKYAFMPAYKTRGEYSLFQVNLDSRRKPRVYQKGTSDTRDFFLGKDNEVIARERFNNKKNLHRIQALHNGDWVDIFTQETEVPRVGFYGVTPDYQHLVMKKQNPENGRWAYYKMSVADGSISEPMFSHPDKDVEGMLSGLDQVIHGVSYSGFTPDYEFFDAKLNARMRGVNKAMPNNTFEISDFTPDWQQIVFFMEGEGSAGDYILYQKGTIEMLTSSRPDIPMDVVHNVKIDEFKARDGLTIPTLITLPINGPDKNLPAIVMPHGGPESYDKTGFHYRAQYFASQGYAVIQPQFRGSTGFGNYHQFSGRGQWGMKMQDDLTDSVHYYAKQGTIDKDRVCIVGGSYGGYAALAGAVFTPDLYKCAVSVNGVSDVDAMMKSTNREYGSDHWVVSYWEEVIAEGEFDEEHLELISPINHVSKVKTPILLIHGQYDEIVPVDQSRDMADELEDADKDVTYIELKKGNHHLSKAKNRMEALLAIDEFVKKHI